MTTMRRLGPDVPLNRSLRPSDPQHGAALIRGGPDAYPGDTMCAHVELPLSRIANPDIQRYPFDQAGLARLAAQEEQDRYPAEWRQAHKIVSMVATLHAGGRLPPVVGNFSADDRGEVWDGYHRIAAAAIAGHVSVEAYLAPPLSHRPPSA